MQRSQVVQMRVTEYEKELVDSLCKIEGLTASETMRLILREACRKRGVLPGGNPQVFTLVQEKGNAILQR